jgi:hypothetical protein
MTARPTSCRSTRPFNWLHLFLGVGMLALGLALGRGRVARRH